MKQLTHIDGMHYCLKLIQKLREDYTALGFDNNTLSIERVLRDVENKIGFNAYKDWKIK